MSIVRNKFKVVLELMVEFERDDICDNFDADALARRIRQEDRNIIGSTVRECTWLGSMPVEGG